MTGLPPISAEEIAELQEASKRPAPTVKWTGDWHPMAKRFPMLSEDELRDLAENIKETGQLNACVMDPTGLGLDGRNRVAACGILGIEPEWVVSTADPINVIIGGNVRHRHMSQGQQAVAVAIGLDEQGLRENGRWKRGSVPDAPDSNESVSTGWHQRVKEAGVILDWRPELADQVLSGLIALDGATMLSKSMLGFGIQRVEDLYRLAPPEDQGE